MRKVYILFVFLMSICNYGLADTINYQLSKFDDGLLNKTYVGKTIYQKDNIQVTVHTDYKLNINKIQGNTVNTINENFDLIQKKLASIHVLLWYYENSPTVSFSNADKNCEINISYTPKLTTLLLDNFDTNNAFVITHEIAHCILTKDVFYHGIDWKYNINEYQKRTLNNILEYKIKQSVCHNKICGINPLIVYHETFADVFSALYLYQKGKIKIEDIEKIQQKRKFLFLQSKQKNVYLSFIALQELINYIKRVDTKSNVVDLNEIISNSLLISQKSLIEMIYDELL